jgi:hypothetical protein
LQIKFVQVFYGREDTLDLIRAHQQNPDAKKPLVLYGEGGCGKTSMLSKAASMSPKWFPGSRPICFVRFLGTTPDSSSLQPTLVSLCQQVCDQLKIHHLAKGYTNRCCAGCIANETAGALFNDKKNRLRILYCKNP